ncbi:MAG: carbamoyltransferase HypF [Nitrospinae bacterium]|nr:carbamoyltransferase HypF [Nitrospinota bacterium]
MSHDPALVRNVITVTGVVQGVGFRPFIFNLAARLGVCGHVQNTSRGVEIEAEGNSGAVESFERAITENAPPLAHIVSIQSRNTAALGTNGFSIAESRSDAAKLISAPPDSDVCDDCLREMFDPADRRHRYPFINCVNCGPRFTIITSVPYDRPNTTMSHFAMCNECRAEYGNPADRRFHAQPVACPACGPKLDLRDGGFNVIQCADPVKETIAILADGRVVAIKGIGGYHLAVDALNDESVATLRQRKRRDEKPFAIMAGSVETLKRFAHVSGKEEALLKSRPHPITLLRKTGDSVMAAVAPRNKLIGAMLPYSPLHHLLFDNAPFGALVMTSANVSDDPIVHTEDDARDRLAGIADYYLTHDRPIHNRADDSIEKVMDTGPVIIRRSRGYTPVPVMLDKEYPDILAVGGELKNTFCVVKGDRAYISQHNGDLKYESAMEAFKDGVGRMLDILGAKPEAVAFDMHPDYMSGHFAREMDIPVKHGVQHHHAHFASLMAEKHFDGEGIGIIFDGTGYGADGAIWGGEFLTGGARGFKRLGATRPVPLLGGDMAVKEPYRIALAVLFDLFENDLPPLPLQWLRELDSNRIDLFRSMAKRSVNAPLSHGMGRMFDAAAALCGVRHISSFEGQAAMELEMAVAKGGFESYPFWIEPYLDIAALDLSPSFRAITGDLIKGVPAGVMAARFHETVARGALAMTKQIRDKTGLDDVFLSGGVFQNSVLTDRLKFILDAEGFRVFTHGRAPSNDGGISLGQALITAKMIG